MQLSDKVYFHDMTTQVLAVMSLPIFATHIRPKQMICINKFHSPARVWSEKSLSRHKKRRRDTSTRTNDLNELERELSEMARRGSLIGTSHRFINQIAQPINVLSTPRYQFLRFARRNELENK